MGKVEFSYKEFSKYVKNNMSTIYEYDGEHRILQDTQPLQAFGRLTEEETLRHIYDNKLFNELEEVITRTGIPYKYREAYKKLNSAYDNLEDDTLKKGDYIKTGASDYTLVLKVKDEDAILFTGCQFIVAHGIQKEGDKAHWNWGEYYDELPVDVFDEDRLKDESKEQLEYEDDWELEP